MTNVKSSMIGFSPPVAAEMQSKKSANFNGQNAGTIDDIGKSQRRRR